MKSNIETEAEMEALGGKLALACHSGIIYLRGELGAGKTTLVRGFLRRLGHRTAVKSPTFTLVEIYHLSGREIYHFDLYRLIAAEEFNYLGASDYLAPGVTWLVEWPERGQGYLPAVDIDIHIGYAEQGRELSIVPRSSLGKEMVNNL